jgi:exopolysaccharide production protein ExoQ
MNPTLASVICACGIAGFFYLNRDNSVRTSKALWLPVIYLWIIGSRSVSSWLGVAPTEGMSVQLDGSPLDARVFGVLLAAAIAVLIWRGKRVRIFLAANWPILIYFLYCLISVTWSYHSDVAFKRWIKALSDIAMVLVMATDGQPAAAFRRFIFRVGFLLLPASVLLIKYYGELGRGYTPDGEPMNTGVTTNKNSLGLVVLVISLGALWSVRALLTDKDAPNRGRRLVAQGGILAFGVALLKIAGSATCVACFILGGGLFLATSLTAMRSRPARVHALGLAIVLVGGLAMLSGGDAGVAHALGRKSNLTGRTEIWAAVIPAQSNPIVGSGFESFWISPDVQKVWRTLSGWWNVSTALNEAHDGYIEIYLNLGWIGVCLIVLIFVTGYLHAVQALPRNPELGALPLTYVIVFTFYNITEAGFRSTGVAWVFLLWAVVTANGVLAGHPGDLKPKIPAPRGGTLARTTAVNGRILESETVYASRRL